MASEALALIDQNWSHASTETANCKISIEITVSVCLEHMDVTFHSYTIKIFYEICRVL